VSCTTDYSEGGYGAGVGWSLRSRVKQQLTLSWN